MSSQGPNPASIGASIAGVGADWTGTGNIFVSDNIYAVSSVPTGGVSDYLRATGFGFSIPVGSTILGIVVEIENVNGGFGVGVIEDNSVLLVKAGVGVGSDKAMAGDWGGADTFKTYGGAADLWGATWTAAEINANNFGVQISAKETGGMFAIAADVDFVRITVHYTPPERSFAVVVVG